MKCRAATLTIACVLLALPGMARAKGGGHGSGGHSGGHGSGGHGASASAARTTPPMVRGRPGIGPPTAGTVMPRPTNPPATGVTTGATAPLPTYPLYGLYRGFGFGLHAHSVWPFAYADSFDAAPLAPAPLDVEAPMGGLQLKIEPTAAQVFVDGYYAGIVDDFRGYYHHLNLAAGPHHLDVLAAGYEPFGFDVLIQAHHTSEYSATLTRSTR